MKTGNSSSTLVSSKTDNFQIKFNIPLPKYDKDKFDSIKWLSKSLLEIYTEPNLNMITSTIIQHYKAKEFSILKDIANSITEFVGFEADQEDFKISKYFSKLVIMYHPDKITSYCKVINSAVDESDLEGLQKLRHIFITIKVLNDYKRIAQSATESTYYEPDLNNYDFDDDFNTVRDDLSYYEDEDIDREFGDFYIMNGKSFYKIYTDLGLVDIYRVELSYTEMEDLDGIETFTYMTFLDLSGNSLSDISNLWELERMEELYLADNQIFHIDTLCNLRNLRILDLANNKIDDITDLNYLFKLEYVNLINNPIPEEQIEELRKYVKIVLF